MYNKNSGFQSFLAASQLFCKEKQMRMVTKLPSKSLWNKSRLQSKNQLFKINSFFGYYWWIFYPTIIFYNFSLVLLPGSEPFISFVNQQTIKVLNKFKLVY